MHSTIRAGKAVICSGAKGLIVGGTIQAGNVLLQEQSGIRCQRLQLLKLVYFLNFAMK